MGQSYLDDPWDETVEAEFEIRAERQHRIAIDPDVFEHLEKEARIQGIVPERLLTNCCLKGLAWQSDLNIRRYLG